MRRHFSLYIVTILLLACQGVHAQTTNMPDEYFQPAVTAGTVPLLPTYSIDPWSSSFNYKRVWVPRTPLQTISNTWTQKVSFSTAYENGFGQTLQTIKHGGLGQFDVVSVNYLNPSKTTYGLLPYVDAKDTKFRMSGFADLMQYNANLYPDEGGYTFSKSEQTISNQVIYNRSMSPGMSFVGADRAGISHTTINDIFTGSDKVYWWTNYGAYGTPEIIAEYAANEITIKHMTADEHNPHVMTFHDKTGQLICKKVQNGSDWLTTYYLYDDMGRMVWIIPPKAMPTTITSLPYALSSATVENLCYHYEYNKYGNVIERKIPDRDTPERTVYDVKQRPVLFQNGVLAAQNKWAFTIYDSKDRVVLTGLFTDQAQEDREEWQNRVNGVNAWPFGVTFEPIISYLWNGFTGTYPTSIGNCEIHTINYYDDYSILPSVFNGISFVSYTNDYINSLETPAPALSDYTHGLLVGTQVRVLDPNNNNSWINSKFFYDFEGRVIQSQTLNPWNAVNAWDVSTTQYDFSGNTVLNILEHNSWAAANKASTKVMTKFIYNYNTGLLTNVRHKTDNSAWVDLASYQYDNFGRVTQKLLGNVEEQNYKYNIRGQLIGINDDYVYNTSANYRKTYGEKICYDYGFAEKRYDGKAAGYIYRGAGATSPIRAYGYLYDEAGRMTLGDFYERHPIGGPSVPPPVFHKNTDYTASNISYDANGNIQSLNQEGMAMVNGNVVPVTMDQLTYNYTANTNRLDNVVDAIGNNYNLHDFLDGNTNGADYDYDEDGNLKKDLNKGITNIAYNYLDLPTVITTNSGTITNIYDANGTLLEKTIAHNVNGTEVEKHWGGFLYRDDQLEYFLHAEGRARWDAADDEFKNDFFVKDHLDNVRTVVNAEITQGMPTQYNAGFELAYANMEESIFDNIGVVRDNKPLGTPQDLMSGLLNGAVATDRVGAAILLEVMAGDQFNLSGYGYYEDEGPFNSYTMPEYMLSSLTDALTGASGEGGEGGPITSTINSLLTSTNYSLYDALKQNNTDPSYPRAYLNYLVFDGNFDLLPDESRVVQLTGSPNSWHLMQLPGTLTMETNGYLLVYMSNESPIDVYVDNEFITHYHGVLLEEQHYYPHGLTIDAGGQANTPLPNHYLHQTKKLQREMGLELYDFHARQYDPQIGRFWGVDPADQFPSGYTGMGNDPANLVDPTGMVVKGTNTVGIGGGTSAEGSPEGIDWARNGAVEGDADNFLDYIDGLFASPSYTFVLHYSDDGISGAGSDEAADNDGDTDDNYVINEDGSIDVTRNDNDYDHFSIVNKYGNVESIGSFKKNSSDLIQLPSIFSFISEDLLASFSFQVKKDNEYRAYISGESLAAIMGAMSETNTHDMVIVGFSLSDGNSPAPSVSHKNGKNGDFRYLRTDYTGGALYINTSPSKLDVSRQNAFNNALYKYGYKDLLSYKYTLNGKTSLLDRTRHIKNHHHHLHIQGFKPTLNVR